MTFKFLSGAAIALSVSAAGFSQVPVQEFTPERFRAHVSFLSDDLLEGREAGTRGYDLAARYVASRYEALGLQPAMNGSWYQEVPFVEYELAGSPRLTIGGQTFAHGEEVVIAPAAEDQPLELEAPAVFVGHGLDMPSRGFDDYAGLDVRGKIAVVVTGYPKGTPSDVGAHISSQKAQMAADRGAVGLIVIRSRAQSRLSSWDQTLHKAKEPDLNWIGPDGQPYDTAPGLRFTATVDEPAAKALFEGAPRGLDEILDEIDEQGRSPKGFALAPAVEVERANRLARFTSPNVLAVLPGSDPALADEYVLLMAHLDGMGTDPDGEGDRIRNGAMDNTTGIATMLEVARQMATSPDRPRRPILFAAVTAEEKGLLGSQYLAKHPVVNGRIVGLVNLDMPILTYDFQDVTAFGAEHSTLGPIVTRAAERMGVAVSPDPLPQEQLFTRSDHYRFVQEGIPAVFLMTGFAGDGQKEFVSFLKGPYHGPDDDLSLAFNWEAGAKFARLNYLIAREIADAAEAPRWYSDSFFGQVFGGDRPRAER